MTRRIKPLTTPTQHNVHLGSYVLDYLAHSFPVQLYEPFTDREGNLSSRPVFRDGQPVQCRDAVERRDRLIERLASLGRSRAPSTRSCSASARTWSPR